MIEVKSKVIINEELNADELVDIMFTDQQALGKEWHKTKEELKDCLEFNVDGFLLAEVTEVDRYNVMLNVGTNIYFHTCLLYLKEVQ